MDRRKILFLHTELAGYFLSGVNYLIENFSVEIYIVRFPVNREAPFNFNFSDNVRVFERNEYDARQLEELVSSINPHFIYCSGWIDKTYLKICKKYYGNIPVVLALDNHWNGSFKQHFATWLSPFTLKNSFSHAWVPGIYQFEYARKLGFKKEQIFTGVYTADVLYFSERYKALRDQKKDKFPKRFLYVGRYTDFKGMKEMWEVFQEIFNETENDWELWCAGTGPLESQFPKHPKIKNLGFTQPDQLGELVENCSVFILPSHFEPWGVVVHEFAAAGFPLLCSDAVGAATSFLVSGYNGFSFQPNDKESLKKIIYRILMLSDDELFRMGDNSLQLALTNTPEIWATRIYELATSF